jgi:phosphoserine phosphatase
VDLPLREDLRTRLAWGHVFALQLLGEAETRAVLRRDADRRGIFLSDEVMDYLLTRFPRDLAHLGGVLDRLDELRPGPQGGASPCRWCARCWPKTPLDAGRPRMNLTLFDLDGTLLPGDSDHAFGEFIVRLGWADAQAFARRNDAFYADYLAGCLDMHAYIEFATAPWRERSPANWRRPASASCRSRAAHAEAPAQALVATAPRTGRPDGLVTATNDFVTRPIAQAAGHRHLIATDLERDAQGGLPAPSPVCHRFREGKITRVRTGWPPQPDPGSFERSTFYSDSTNDLPLLERVSHPVATNPGPALERIAQAARLAHPETLPT